MKFELEYNPLVKYNVLNESLIFVQKTDLRYKSQYQSWQKKGYYEHACIPKWACLVQTTHQVLW